MSSQGRLAAAPLTRRGVFGLLGGLTGGAALAALAACGQPSSASPSSGTRRVPSANGGIEVPAQPKRVVSLDKYSMGAMFDLGQEPIGLYGADEQNIEQQFLTRWRGIAKVSDGTGGPVDLAKLAALQPDLILAHNGTPQPYDKLSQLAPTVILGYTNSKMPWRDLTVTTAEALGRTDELIALHKRYTDRVAQLKAKHADVLDSTSWNILQGGINQGQYTLYGPASQIGGILQTVGVQFASASASVTDPKGQQPVSYERIDRLADGDAILYYTANDGKPANLGPELVTQPAFRRLKAARSRHVFGTTYFLPTCYSDALGALDALDRALATL